MKEFIKIITLILTTFYLSIFSYSAFALKDGDTIRIIVPYSPGGGMTLRQDLPLLLLKKKYRKLVCLTQK